MRLRRLAWAGVEIVLGDTRLLIDPLQHVEPLFPALGAPRWPVPALTPPAGTHALLTHLHPDHYDHELIARLAVSGTVGVHAPSAPAVAEAGIDPVPQELGEPRRVGSLTVTPVTSLPT